MRKIKKNTRAWITKRGKGLLFKTFNKVKQHVIFWGILALLLVLAYNYVEKKLFTFTIERVNTQLEDNERRKAIINFRENTLILVERDGEHTEVKLTPGLREAEIVQDLDGSVRVIAPTWGFVFEPGYTTFVSQGKPHVGLDIQWFYWRRLGLSSGGGVRGATKQVKDRSLEFGAYPLALNYNLPFRWTPNTNLFLGMDDQIKPTFGATVKW